MLVLPGLSDLVSLRSVESCLFHHPAAEVTVVLKEGGEELVQHLEGMKTQLSEKNEEIKALKEENSGLKKRLSKQSGMLQVRAASL